MNDLIELTREEQMSIEGGGWIKEFGAWCHETWCEIKEAVSDWWEETTKPCSCYC
jgi:hypothetical protein